MAAPTLKSLRAEILAEVNRRIDARLRAALSDVARLTDGCETYRKHAVTSLEQRDRARAMYTEKCLECDKAEATLAAVRKVADDYHDVDVVGDPPHEVALNPCANEVLLALDGEK